MGEQERERGRWVDDSGTYLERRHQQGVVFPSGIVIHNYSQLESGGREDTGRPASSYDNSVLLFRHPRRACVCGELLEKQRERERKIHTYIVCTLYIYRKTKSRDFLETVVKVLKLYSSLRFSPTIFQFARGYRHTKRND